MINLPKDFLECFKETIDMVKKEAEIQALNGSEEDKIKSMRDYQWLINSIDELNILLKELDKLMHYPNEELNSDERKILKAYIKAINCAIVTIKKEINKLTNYILEKRGN